MLWCSLSVFIGLSAISQGGVTRFIPGILVSTTILFYLIVIRANSVTYSSLKQFNTKTGVLSIASSAGTLCCVADTIYHMVMKSGAISKLMSKDISTTTIQAVVVIALLTMSFIAMYGVSVIFNYILSNVATLIDTIIDKKYEINNIVAIVVCALYFFLIVWVYRNTTAFYGSGYNDVIYGSDSYTLTGSNVWLSLFQGQNDLRQPLYMLTVAPFMGMSDDEILAAHGILSYSQTLEWKGAVEYCMTDRNGTAIEKKIDTSLNYYGTVLNAQTLEHAVPNLQNSVEKIIVIENKANYESMEYDPKVLYIFCHGYFSPKEVRFLQMLMKTAPEEIQCYHWGDMDYGGIQIFLYNEKNIFPNLIPWKMDVPSYKAALEKEKGIKLCSKKQKKLEALNAGKLEVLKQCILENKMEIEQEMLI